MPELTTLDVELYTRGRLAEADANTARQLASALSLARRYCGWHVTPVKTDSLVTIDGPGGQLLVLPTLRLIQLAGLTEDGNTVDADTISASARGLLRKKDGSCWTDQLGGIDVSMVHGFADAPEWQSAVLSYIDRTSLAIGGGGREVVGPFQFTEAATAEGSPFTSAEKMLLDLYKLEAQA
jgi:hypothetical protein